MVKIRKCRVSNHGYKEIIAFILGYKEGTDCAPPPPF